MTWWKPWTWGQKDERTWEVPNYADQPREEKVFEQDEPWVDYQREKRIEPWSDYPRGKRVELPVSKKPTGDLFRSKERSPERRTTEHDDIVPILVPLDSGFGFGSTPIFVPSTYEREGSLPSPDPVKGIQNASDAVDETLNRASDAIDGSKWSGGGSGDYGSHSGAGGSGASSFDSGSYGASDSGSSHASGGYGGYGGSSSPSSDSGSSYSGGSSSSDSGSSSSSSSDSGSSSSSSGGGE